MSSPRQLERLIAPVLLVVVKVKYDMLVKYLFVAQGKYLINDDNDNDDSDDDDGETS